MPQRSDHRVRLLRRKCEGSTDMAGTHQLATLQLAIMQVLWRLKEATVAEVRESLAGDRDLAHTTIATMLVKLERKGVVDHRAEGRAYIYRALIEPQQVKSTMVTDLVERLFGGNLTAMVTHLLDESDVSREELSRLKALISRKEKEVHDDV
ncbi:MAG: BlaI/MecI/CopY family transcriptional regulator [Planctomycetota bacterium]